MQRIEYIWVRGTQCSDRICKFMTEIDAIMIPTLSERVCISDYAGKLAEKAETVFVVRDGCDIASCSVYCNTRIAFITSFAVKKNWMKQHIGTSLMNEVKRHIKERGCQCIQLEVHSQNIVALEFYKRTGFVIISENGEWKKMEYQPNSQENKMNKSELNSSTVYVYVQTYQLAKDYIKRALDSIHSQTYTNFRCVIYDNCSKPDVRKILQEYVETDERFTVTYFDQTEGHIIAWEYGIPEILHLAGDRGGYYCRVDADDELEPECFEKMISSIKKNKLDMVASGSVFIEADTMKVAGIRGVESNTILEGDLFEKYFPMYYQIMRTHWGKMYAIDVIKKMNLSNFRIVPYGGDTLFVREAMLKSKRVGIIAEPLYKYYLYPEVRDYNLKEGRIDAPKKLLERDLSFLLQKCGKISSNTIAWLINVYLSENNDVFNLIAHGHKDSQQKIEDVYSVISSIPCRMAMRLGEKGRYTYLCNWLFHQDILENEQTLSRCAEIFGILCILPNQVPNGRNADYFRFLVKLHDFWDEYDSKHTIEENIVQCARNSLLLQNCDFYYCKFNAEIVVCLLRENYEEAYEIIKESIKKKDYFDERFIGQNIELGQNVAAVLQNEAEFIYMNKKKMELLAEDNLPEALEMVNEWIEILPEDEELLNLQKKIICKKEKKKNENCNV